MSARGYGLCSRNWVCPHELPGETFSNKIWCGCLPYTYGWNQPQRNWALSTKLKLGNSRHDCWEKNIFSFPLSCFFTKAYTRKITWEQIPLPGIILQIYRIYQEIDWSRPQGFLKHFTTWAFYSLTFLFVSSISCFCDDEGKMILWDASPPSSNFLVHC